MDFKDASGCTRERSNLLTISVVFLAAVVSQAIFVKLVKKTI